MQYGQRCDGLNEMSLDWNPIQVTRSVDSTRCNNIVVPEVDSTSTQLDSNQAELIQIKSTNHHKVDLAIP